MEYIVRSKGDTRHYLRKSDVTRYGLSHFNATVEFDGKVISLSDWRFKLDRTALPKDPKPGQKSTGVYREVRRALKGIRNMQAQLTELWQRPEMMSPNSKEQRLATRYVKQLTAWREFFTNLVNALPENLPAFISNAIWDHYGYRLDRSDSTEWRRYLTQVKPTSWKITRIFKSKRNGIGLVTNGNFTAWLDGDLDVSGYDLSAATSVKKAVKLSEVDTFTAMLTWNGKRFVAAV